MRGGHDFRGIDVKLTALGSLVLLGVAVSACAPTPEAARTPAAAPIAVTIAQAATTDLPATFETGGIVRARLTAVVASRLMAPVIAVHVGAGDTVRRGAPLIELDAREWRANSERSAASAIAADDTVAAADADVAAARAALTLATATHHRVADLATRKSATAQELDQAVSALDAATAQVRSAEARRSAARAGSDVARAARAVADTTLSYTTLLAPFDAIVSQRNIDPGTMAVPGAPLLILEDPHSLRVETMLDESRAAFVTVGTSVDVALGAEGDRAALTWIAARVTEIARVDPASHAFSVKIDLPPALDARSGSFARVRVTGPPRRALTVPESAVLRRGQLTFVYAVDSGSVARLRAISIGQAIDGRVEVLAGLADQSTVIAPVLPALTDGRAVQIDRASDGAGR
ncbi:MAG: efflux RND transporter periplasmic adaptor subunit [Vicinamibacterales bacterium]